VTEDPEREERKSRVAKPSRGAGTNSTRCLSRYEKLARAQGYSAVAGVDEVGRGALFGPVFAAAVILNPDRQITGLRDSKVLDAEARTRLATEIKSKCVDWAVGAADAFEIDQINIYQASRLAMKRAIVALRVRPDYLLIDAIRVDLPIKQEPLIGGDARCRAIAAASIVAKVCRDACMDQWHALFPRYNLASNKGYSTPCHRRALADYGPTSIHRFSFLPVRLSCKEVWWTDYQAQISQEDLFASPALGKQE
jgi:ribonuclease HII